MSEAAFSFFFFLLFISSHVLLLYFIFASFLEQIVVF